MRNDMNELKKFVYNNMYKEQSGHEIHRGTPHAVPKVLEDIEPIFPEDIRKKSHEFRDGHNETIEDTHEIVEESLSLADKEIELIQKALEKHNGKRKNAAIELGISERTLYRKIKEYNIE